MPRVKSIDSPTTAPYTSAGAKAGTGLSSVWVGNHVFGTELLGLEVHETGRLGSDLFGTIKFRIAGQEYGDEEQSADLRASVRWAKVFLASAGRRSRPDLDEASTDDVFHELYGKYVGRQKTRPGPWTRDPFVLDDIGDASIRDIAGVVAFRRSDNGDRVVVKSLTTLKLDQATLPEGELDATIRSLCDWVDAQKP